MSKPLNKPKIANVKAMSNAGMLRKDIQKATGLSLSTIRDYINKYETDTELLNSLTASIKKNMNNERLLIDSKTGQALNSYLDDVITGKKQPNPIAITAIKDRNFQQYQLISGQPTELNATVVAIKDIEALRNEAHQLTKQLRKDDQPVDNL